MNADSSLPNFAGEVAPASILAYCRRLPYFSCSALTRGVKTNDPKFRAMRPPPTQPLRFEVLVKELFHPHRDFFAMRLQREVAGVQHVRLHVFQVAPVRRCTVRRKDEIVLSPHDQRG